MEYTYNLFHLLHLVSVSFAVGLAYVALDRFRYVHRSIEMYEEAIKEIKIYLKRVKDPGKKDTAETLLLDKIKNISRDGFWLFPPPSKKVGINSGVIYITLFLNTISLCVGSLYPEVSTSYIFYSVFGIAIAGIVLPLVFIYIGNYCFEKEKEYIRGINDGFNQTYKYSIKMLKDKK